MSDSKRKRGDASVKFIPTVSLEPTRVSLEREDKILSSVPASAVTDIAYLGPTLSNGQMNWDCTCNGSLPFGPCGPGYRRVMECFRLHEHEADHVLAEKCGLFNTFWRSCMG